MRVTETPTLFILLALGPPRVHFLTSKCNAMRGRRCIERDLSCINREQQSDKWLRKNTPMKNAGKNKAFLEIYHFEAITRHSKKVNL